MKPGTLLWIFRDVVDLATKEGYIAATGDFDDTKFNDIQSDLGFAAGVEAILKKYGVAIPGKVDQIIQIIPLLAGLFKA